jgi:hypothetical protein
LAIAEFLGTVCHTRPVFDESAVYLPAGCQRQADEAIADANRQWQRRLRELEEEWQDRLQQTENGWGELVLENLGLILHPDSKS